MKREGSSIYEKYISPLMSIFNTHVAKSFRSAREVAVACSTRCFIKLHITALAVVFEIAFIISYICLFKGP